jgi:hypothetical protein
MFKHPHTRILDSVKVDVLKLLIGGCLEDLMTFTLFVILISNLLILSVLSDSCVDLVRNSLKHGVCVNWSVTGLDHESMTVRANNSRSFAIQIQSILSRRRSNKYKGF